MFVLNWLGSFLDPTFRPRGQSSKPHKQSFSCSCSVFAGSLSLTSSRAWLLFTSPITTSYSLRCLSRFSHGSSALMKGASWAIWSHRYWHYLHLLNKYFRYKKWGLRTTVGRSSGSPVPDSVYLFTLVSMLKKMCLAKDPIYMNNQLRLHFQMSA